MKDLAGLGSVPPPRRRAAVYGLILLLVGGTFLEVWTGERHWPFSEYPMYSRIAGSSFQRPLLYGVTPEDAEVPLLARDQLHPLSAAQVRQTMRRLLRSPDPASNLRRALLDVGRRYEEGRLRGRHSGAPLVAVRLYDCSWDVTEDERPGPPDRRELRFEVGLSDAAP